VHHATAQTIDRHHRTAAVATLKGHRKIQTCYSAPGLGVCSRCPCKRDP
jgi:hypothetical protein